MTNTIIASHLQEQVALPFGYTALFKWNGGATLEIEWEPDVPRINTLRAQRKFFSAYKDARNAVLQQVATLRGTPSCIVELTPEGEINYLVIDPATKH